MIKLVVGMFITITLGFGTNLLPIAEKTYVMDFTKETRCLVRNLHVYKDPKWVGKIVLTNGKKMFFSSPKSLIEFYLRPGKWFDIGVKSEKDFKDIIVTDYLTLKPINAKEAFYIYGSRAISPAGDDLVAIENERDAKIFSANYSGKRVFRFNEISDALIRLIDGRI